MMTIFDDFLFLGKHEQVINNKNELVKWPLYSRTIKENILQNILNRLLFKLLKCLTHLKRILELVWNMFVSLCGWSLQVFVGKCCTCAQSLIGWKHSQIPPQNYRIENQGGENS